MKRTSRKWYYLLQGLAWSLFSLMHVLFSTMYMPLNLSSVLNGLFIGGAGLVISHGLRLCYSASWFDINRVWSLLFRALLCVIVATALWELAIIVVLHIGILNYYDWQSISLPATVFWYYYYFVVLSLWSLLYFSSKIMVRRRRELVEKLQLEISLRDAELQNLKWQMNPHFLFNSLNSVRAMILEDPHKARTMITQMSGLLRQSLSTTAQKTVPLSVELECARAYLALEKVRFEERLNYAIDVSDAVLGEHVLPMSVQTLVENALKHGISHSPAGGTVTLQARKVGERLEICVANIGRLSASARENTGLANTRERLRLVFGDASGLTLQQADENTVLATLWIEQS